MSFKDRLILKVVDYLDRISFWLEHQLDEDEYLDFKIGGTD